MKKKIMSLVLAGLLGISMAGCGLDEPAKSGDTAAAPAGEEQTSENEAAETAEGDTSKGPVTISFVSFINGEDAGRRTLEKYLEIYEQETGNTVKESAGTADETWKASIQADFQSNAEPDVLYYFNGVDSDAFIKEGKVVSIEEIREAFPEYGSNMKEELLVPSPYDGVVYSKPHVGFWEALFCNKNVLEAAGVEIPSLDDYTWDQFLDDCQKIKDAGYTPIALSVQQIPHYWFEYAQLNASGPDKHMDIPVSIDDEAAGYWAQSLDDIKELYDRGFFPENTLTATDDEIIQMMGTDEAAFCLDGSWRVTWFEDNADPNDFIAVFPPSKGNRKTTDYIGGISSGLFITRKAWNDPAKREACVKLVETLTCDEATFEWAVSGQVTALKNTVEPEGETHGLMDSIFAMNGRVTSISPAVQDSLEGNVRDNLFSNVKNVCTEKITSKDAIQEMLDMMNHN